MKGNFCSFIAIAACVLILPGTAAMAETVPEEDLTTLAHKKFTDFGSEGEKRAFETFFEKIQNGQKADLTPERKSVTDPRDLKILTDPVYAELWEKDRVIKAEWLVWLCSDPRACAKVTPRGIEIAEARIDGKVELDFARIPFPFRFLACAFSDILLLTGAQLPFLDLSGSYLRGLQANWAQIETSVLLNNGFRNQGELSLLGARVGGDLRSDGGQVTNWGGYALSWEGAKIAGNVFLCNGFTAEGEVRLLGALIGGDLDCSGSTLSNQAGNALSCGGAKIAGNVFLRDGFTAEGEVQVVGATIGGDLDCSGGTLTSEVGSALSCDGAKITGNAFLNNGFKADGGVRLIGATIGANLDCDGSQLLNRKGYALAADHANINGSVSLSVFLKNSFKAEGHVSLLGALIGGDLDCSGGTLTSGAGSAISCDGAKIAGNVFLRNGFKADGEVGLVGATIGANLDCNGGQMINRGGYALFGEGAKINGNAFLRNGFKAEGEVRLVGATIGANLDCDGGQLLNRKGYALSADHVNITGNVFVRNGFKAEGDVEMVGATIGGDLDCSGGTLTSEAGSALSCDGAKITGNVFLNNGFKAEGGVRFDGATIGGGLGCARGVLIGQAGSALSCDAAKITGSVFLQDGFKAEGKVSLVAATIGGDLYLRKVTSPKLALLDLRSAKVGTLADDEMSWPSKKRVSLDGFTYDRIDDDSPTDADFRVKWLKLQGEDRFLPQPYEQLAAVLRKMGHDEEAVKVMIKKNDAQALYVDFPSEQWWWYKGFGRLIVYGYRPWYAFGCSLFVIGIGGWLFWCGHKHKIMTPAKKEACEQKSQFQQESGQEWYPQFSPYIYALENFVPLLNLQMAEYWMPNAKRDAKPSFLRDAPLLLAFGLCVLPLRLLFYLRKLVFWLIFVLRNRLTSGTRSAQFCMGPFVPPTIGSVLRYYLWFHIIAGWVLTTLWVAALTGLVKS